MSRHLRKTPSLQVGVDPNYVNIDLIGHMTLEGEATQWKDQLSDALTLQENGSGISINKSESVVEFAYNATYNANFSLADAAFTNIQLNHDKKISANIYPHIHWFQEKNYSPNFLLGYRWHAINGQKTTAWTLLNCNNLAFTYSGSLHQISYSAPITPPPNSNISDIVQFRVYRDTSNASAYFSGSCPYNTGGNAVAGVLYFDVHFPVDSLSSNTEFSKL